MNAASQDRADQMFKALGDPTRRALFERLSSGGEQTVNALTKAAGVSQPAVSKHLAILKAAGLVGDRREGRENHYRAELQALSPLVDWVSYHLAFWEGRMNRLEGLLKRMDQ